MDRPMEGGRSYLQRLNLGSGSRSSLSSRKGKKSSSSSSSEKPKQPQRGLGVAQLEKIRLQDQMKEHMEDSRVEILRLSPSSSSSSNLGSSLYGVHPSAMIGYGDTEEGVLNYRDYGPNTSTSSKGLNSIAFQYYSPPSVVTLPLFENYLEDSTQMMRHDRRQSIGSITQNSDSKKQELDLELRLSL